MYWYTVAYPKNSSGLSGLGVSDQKLNSNSDSPLSKPVYANFRLNEPVFFNFLFLG